MELKRNRILRRRRAARSFPRYEQGKTDWGGIINSGGNFAQAAIGAFASPPKTGELVNETDRYSSNGSGFTYNKLGYVDADSYFKQNKSQNINSVLQTTASGAATGALIGGGWGALIGGVVGLGTGIIGSINRTSKLERRLNSANDQIRRTNIFNMASAHSDYMQNQYNLEHGDLQEGLLYSAKRGKDLIKPIFRI